MKKQTKKKTKLTTKRKNQVKKQALSQTPKKEVKRKPRLTKEKREKLQLKSINRSVLLFIGIYLVVLSAYLAIMSFSKYAGVITDAEDTISVAKWDVALDTSNTNSQLRVVTGTNGQTYTLKVTSQSDVACYYSIEISNVPTGMEVVLDGTTTYYESNNTITINNAGTFIASNILLERTHTLTFSAPLTGVSETEQTMTLDVTFVQSPIS